MSRIGKRPVSIPDKVKVKYAGGVLHAEGPKGKLDFKVHEAIDVEVTDKAVVVKRRDDDKENIALHGMVRAIISNMVTGVASGFTKELEIIGVGYKAEAKGKHITLQLGFSHPVEFPLPDGIEAKVDKQTRITLTGCDKHMVGEVAAKIRDLRPPEPYKGKGIRYVGEYVRHKVGKAAAAATSG